MERISGRIKRAWRHRRGKGRVAGAVMAAVLTLSTVLGALAPVAAYAVGGQAYLKMDHSITYGGGRQNTMARTATAWMLPAMIAAAVVCALVSGLIGLRLLRRQFERAGITAAGSNG